MAPKNTRKSMKSLNNYPKMKEGFYQEKPLDKYTVINDESRGL